MDDSTEENQIYYRPQWSHVDVDGALMLRVSIWEGAEHTSAIGTISVDDPDYFFWAWVMGSDNNNRTLTTDDVDRLKSAFQAGVVHPNDTSP